MKLRTKLQYLLKEFDEQVSVKDPGGRGRYNWGLHPQFGPEYWNSGKRKKTLWFDPNCLSDEAYAEHPPTEDKGIWATHRSETSGISISIDIASKTINILGSLQDPRISYLLTTSNTHIPELGDYIVRTVNRSESDSHSENYYKVVGSLKDVVSKKKTISGKAPDFTERGGFKEFKHDVLEDISDIDWYHATRLSHLDSILQKGLLPSNPSKQGTGWTSYNFNLQKVVYLTSDVEYANDIAATLLERFGKPAIVIKIAGSALKDYTKLVVDEDSLRDEYNDNVNAGMLKAGIPDYMTSAVDKIQSIGYSDIIPASNLEIIQVYDYEHEENDDDVEHYKPEVLSYTWQEWKNKDTKSSTSLKEKLNYLLEEDDLEQRREDDAMIIGKLTKQAVVAAGPLLNQRNKMTPEEFREAYKALSAERDEFIKNSVFKTNDEFMRWFENKTRMSLIKEAAEPRRMKKHIPLPDDLLRLSDIFKAAGKKFYLVGGAVRDSLLGKEPKDLDIATDASPEDVRETLAAYPEYKVLDLGVAFGIVKIITPEGNDYEIARFRKDLSGGRRPDAVEFTTIDQDVARRDLSINALFYDIETQEVVDYVGGIDDIKNKVVKTVGNPQDRFNEDRLRILRALRFAARFETTIDPETDKAILNDNSLKGVSGERIRDEFLKGIKSSRNPADFYRLIDRYDLWSQILPGLTVNEDRPETKDAPIALALILRDNPADLASKKLNAAKYSAEEITKIKFLLDLINLTPDNAMRLKRQYKNSRLSDDDLLEFASQSDRPDMKLIKAFIEYEPSVNAADLPEFSGKELGAELSRRESEIFRNMLRESKKNNLSNLLKRLF
jgi:tRNA nucleotidyltransferase/poly(A) polymerase